MSSGPDLIATKNSMKGSGLPPPPKWSDMKTLDQKIVWLITRGIRPLLSKTGNALSTTSYTQASQASSDIADTADTLGGIPDEILREIFGWLPGKDIARASAICRRFRIAIDDDPLLSFKKSGNYFGQKDWEEYFGDVGVEPPLPEDIVEILKAPCPVFNSEGKDAGLKVKDTHFLTLIPAAINGDPLTLDLIRELVKSPKNGGNAIKYEYYYPENHNSTPVSKSHWMLMSKDVIPNSKGKSYLEQLKLLPSGHEAPHLIDAVVSIFMHYVHTKERLFSDNPLTYTRCQEKNSSGKYQMSTGGFSGSGLFVCTYDFIRHRIGLCVSRKF